MTTPYPSDGLCAEFRAKGIVIEHLSTYAGYAWAARCLKCGSFIVRWDGQESADVRPHTTEDCINGLALRIKELEQRLDAHNF